MSGKTVKQNPTKILWIIPRDSETMWHQLIGIFKVEIIICQKCFLSSLETLMRQFH